MDKPIDIDAACAGHPAAERQLRALRAVANAYCCDRCHSMARGCSACDRIAELDAADAAARGDV